MENDNLARLSTSERRAIDWSAAMQWLDAQGIARKCEGIDTNDYSLLERMLLLHDQSFLMGRDSTEPF